MAQPDPSHNVSQELMPHVHLVSSFRYPALSRIDVNEVAKMLMAAPQVARDRAPFFWTYLDRPQDGTTLLVWQPLQRLGNNFASDGFVWAPHEQLFKHDVGNGLMLEIYYYKSGYIPGEQHALHARRRFRLVPVPGHPNPPPVDVSLFIVHYGPSEMNDRIPVNMIPYDERVNASIQQRHYLMRQGQIRRKEFMLSDRVNWPSLPEINRQQMAPQTTPRGVPQQMAYPPQATPGPPAKRAKHSQSQGPQQGMPGMPAIDGVLDDDEDTSRGDMFDHLTPRELSSARYQQNHEWMEEILSSPYRLNQITPPDLGLGLKGELASLTEGVFQAQGGEALQQVPERPYVGRLDPGQAEEFRKRVQAHVESTKSEIEKMRAEHEEALASMKQTSLFAQKEKELRSLTDGSGTEVWRLEGRVDAEDNKRPGSDQAVKTTIDSIAQQVEELVGRKINSNGRLWRAQDGGYQSPAPEPSPPAPNDEMSRQMSQTSGPRAEETDVDMGGTAAGLLDQMGTGLSSTSTPINNYETPQAHLSAPTPAGANANAPSAPTAQGHAAPASAQTSGTATAQAPVAKQSTPDQGTDSGDWVVVPKATDGPPEQQAVAGSAPPPATVAQAAAPQQSNPAKGSSAAPTPTGSTSFDQNDFSSLGDLDTAGEALSGYDAPALDGSAGDLGDGLDLQMDMEDSAFGDAFHGVSQSGTPGDGQGQDM